MQTASANVFFELIGLKRDSCNCKLKTLRDERQGLARNCTGKLRVNLRIYAEKNMPIYNVN